MIVYTVILLCLKRGWGYSIGIRVPRAAFNYLFIYFTTAWYMGLENAIIFSKNQFKKV